jgi:hypothetical protein
MQFFCSFDTGIIFSLVETASEMLVFSLCVKEIKSQGSEDRLPLSLMTMTLSPAIRI